MTVTEYIAKLERLLELYGDLEVMETDYSFSEEKMVIRPASHPVFRRGKVHGEIILL